MANQVKTDDEARESLKKGIDTIANVVKRTLGPKGRNVTFMRPYSGVVVTNDGVTIAKEMNSDDLYEDQGMQLIKQVAQKTDDNAGDGTTTATILAQALVAAGKREVDNGANPIDVKKTIDEDTEKVVEYIKKQAKDIKTKEEVAQVGTISSRSAEVGNIIAETLELIGRDGVISVEDGPIGITNEVTEGMQFSNGWITPFFITDPKTMKSSLDHPAIILTDQALQYSEFFIPLFEQIVKSGKKEIVLIAKEVMAEALQTLVLNKMQGKLNILAVKAPYFGDRQFDVLNDIAALTGATVLSDDGISIKDATLAHLGTARRVEADKTSTVIVEGDGDKKAIEERIEIIKGQIEAKGNNLYEKEFLEMRLAKLAGGVGIIKVGAMTDAEQEQLKYNVEDAVKATKSAIAEGIVAGGGITLYNASSELTEGIVKKAIKLPAKQILLNAGLEAEVILSKLKAPGEGYDAAKESYGDMISMGVIDPAKVVRNEIQNASSIAGMVLTTEAVLVDLRPEKEAE